MKKILVVTCYFDPDYVRARSLRAALGKLPNVQVVVVKNSTKGLLRYPQVIWRLLLAQRREKPDAYLLTFRVCIVFSVTLFTSVAVCRSAVFC